MSDLEGMSRGELLNWINSLGDQTKEKILSLPSFRQRLRELGVKITELGDLNISEIAIAGSPANLEKKPILTKEIQKDSRGERTMPNNENQTANTENINLTDLFEVISELRELAEQEPELSKLSQLANKLEGLIDTESPENEAERELEMRAAEKMQKEGMTHTQAVIAVSKEDDKLYQKLSN